MFWRLKIPYTNKLFIETQSQTGDQKLISGMRWLLQIVNKNGEKANHGGRNSEVEGRSDKEEAVIKAEGMKRRVAARKKRYKQKAKRLRRTAVERKAIFSV